MLALGGCVSDRVSPRHLPGSTLDQARGPDENAKLYTDLIRQLIDQDKLYAALAHLQSREQEFGVSDELRLLRADILRKMDDRDGAEALYRRLLKTSYSAQANHGLGLIYARTDIANGVEYLRRAVEQNPTDAQMRNDLGYALLRQGQMADARLQLTTAFQLDQNNELNRNNYILLLLAEGRSQRAAGLAARNQIPPKVMDDLRAEARQLSASADTARTPPRAVQRPPKAAPALSVSTRNRRPAPVVGGGGG
ncbi:tetratricopeptide repeat protein [Salinisphaera aquimarina]